MRIKNQKIKNLLYKSINKIVDFSSEIYEKIIENYEQIPEILNLEYLKLKVLYIEIKYVILNKMNLII